MSVYLFKEYYYFDYGKQMALEYQAIISMDDNNENLIGYQDIIYNETSHHLIENIISNHYYLFTFDFDEIPDIINCKNLINKINLTIEFNRINNTKNPKIELIKIT